MLDQLQAPSSHLSLLRRLRRNRKNPGIRSLLQETVLQKNDLIAPLFVLPGDKKTTPFSHFPNISAYSIEELVKKAEELHTQGIQAVALFPCIDPSLKDAIGSEALNPRGTIPQALSLLKKEIPSLNLIVDIALDPYTTHGHDGVLEETGLVDNDNTVFILGKMALLYAEKGADVVAPSDMMDGRIQYIRNQLEGGGHKNTTILSYSIKYASHYYGPFRFAMGSKLIAADKKNYQMNPANVREALLEAELDEKEGADILMVKPAGLYLDVIAKLRQTTFLPIAAYQVSGEYAMLHQACQKGYLPYPEAILEAVLAIKRAGADCILTYAVEDLLPLLS